MPENTPLIPKPERKRDDHVSYDPHSRHDCVTDLAPSANFPARLPLTMVLHWTAVFDYFEKHCYCLYVYQLLHEPRLRDSASPRGMEHGV